MSRMKCPRCDAAALISIEYGLTPAPLPNREKVRGNEALTLLALCIY